MKGSIVKRGSTWSCVLYLGTGEDGKKRQKWTSHKTRKEAEVYLSHAVNRLHGGDTLPSTRMKTGEWLRQWIETEVSIKLAPKTICSYKETVEAHLIPEMGLIPLTKLSPVTIQEFIQRKLDGGLSPTSVRYQVSILSIGLSRAVRLGMIARNPCQLVTKPRKAHHEKAVFDADQARAFLNYAKEKEPEYYPFFLAAILTGARQGELGGLRWADLDLVAGTARITQIAQRLGDSVVFKSPKTKGSKRTIPLGDTLVETLRKLKAEVGERRLAFGPQYKDNDLVFCQPNGKPLQMGNVTQRVLPRILKGAGLPKIPFHGLRHVHASLLLAGGVNIKVVSERLGHSSITMTLGTYSHLLPGLQEQAVNALDADLFANGKGKGLAKISKKPIPLRVVKE